MPVCPKCKDDSSFTTLTKNKGDRVALAHEEIETYDASYYETQLVRAIESVLLPLGWDRTEIQQELTALEDTTLSSFSPIGDLS